MAWEEIDSTTLGSAAASVTFNSGLGGYAFYRITAYIANDGTNGRVYVMFNSDTGANYVYQTIEAYGTSASGTRQTAMNKIIPDATYNDLLANNEESFTMIVAKPAAGVKAQTVSQAGFNASPVLALIGGEWNNTADLISSITLTKSSGNFAAGTSILLEGLDF